MATIFSENSEKKPAKFICEKCDYICFKKQHLKQHFLSKKHKNAIGNNVENSVNNTETQKHICECGKVYQDRSGLWKHKKCCQQNSFVNSKSKNADNIITPELIIEIIKQNKELQQTLIEQNKTIIDLAQKTGTHNSYNNNNNNNKTFNLQLYLNETCKDALNIMDFVNQLKIGIKDLEETGRLGFADGISKIFINGLKQLDVSNRPVHCSDSKREILYIKNNNEWNKEDDERKVLTSAIKHVVNKNIKQIPEWTKVNPDYNDYHSKQNDKYLQIVMESMSGSSQEEANKNYNKIIKNIAKETVIEKEKCIVSLTS
jgi:hypothetical protein